MSDIIKHDQTGTAYDMIRQAIADPAVDPAKLQALLCVKEQWEAGEARKAFASAMADFQARCPIIEKGDTAHNKKYARIDRIHRTIRPLRQECGFWITWQVCEVKDGMAHLEGILGHRDGHTVDIRQTIPIPAGITGQNEAQRAGSAQTYAKRYGECMALGIVTGDDDDGNGGMHYQSEISIEDESAIRELCEEQGRDFAKALAYAKSKGVDECLAVLKKGAR